MGRIKNFVREEVLDKAIQVFWEKGFADTSLSDLEKATGVNKSGLYSEFKDKEDIFHESIKRYRDIHPGYKILEVTPLGWHNIEMFMKSFMTCKGKKGCFFINSIRDTAILPTKTSKLMSENGLSVLEMISKNLKAAGLKTHTEIAAKMITSFAGGVSLKLNAMKADDLFDEVDEFLKLMKTTYKL